MRKESKWAIGTAVAAVAGYIAGILTAPKSGRDTRKDISNKATLARHEGEKQLKNLYSELGDTVEKAESQLKKAKTKASKEFKDAIENAKTTKDKTRLILSALHEGDADDPELKKMIKQGRAAKNNLAKFLKK